MERLDAAFGVSLRRAPAYSSVRIILRGLDAAEMERVLRDHAASLADTAGHDVDILAAVSTAPLKCSPAGDALAAPEWQPHVKTILRVTRQTLCRTAATGPWEERPEAAFCFSSAAGLPAAAWAAAIRGHWGIENRNHYVRDVSCGEDQSRIRANPGIIARARSFALNILRKNAVTNVAHALWNNALSLDRILAYKAI